MNGAPLVAAAGLDPQRLSAAGPKLMLQGMAASLGVAVEPVPRVPSLAYRLCMAARGSIDFATAGENSHDWDIAAADLVLEEAGARLIDGLGRTARLQHRENPAPRAAGRPGRAGAAIA